MARDTRGRFTSGKDAYDISLSYTQDDAALAAQVAPVMFATADKAQRLITATARSYAPVRTGNLARSIEGDPINVRSPWLTQTGVTAHAKYAAFVEYPTRPHRIAARNAKALRFPGPGGRMIFARSVWHPGTRGNPFMRDAAATVVNTYFGGSPGSGGNPLSHLG